MIHSLELPYSIEQGFVIESHVGEGTVRVRTVSGRTLEHVRLASMLASPGTSGMSAMPLPGTECIVFVSTTDEHYILGLFPPAGDRKGVDDPSASTLPGEFRLDMETGHVSVTPDGTIDFMSHPWLRAMFIGREHLLREFARNWERVSTPLNLLRYVNNETEQLSLFELFVNDRFLYREGDTTPSIVWTLGRNHPDISSRGNPRDPFLSFFQVESRLDSTGEAIARSSEQQGLIDGVVRRDVNWVQDGNVTHTEERGHFAGTDGQDVKKEVIDADGTPVWSVEIRDDGRAVIKNPSWTITLQENKVAVIESESTRIKINGERIELGANGDHEPMVMGTQLVDFLDQLVTWLTTHTHPTPSGPSAPSIQAPQLTSLSSQFAIPQGAPNSKLTSNANYVSGGSGYPSGGDAATEE